MSLGIVQGTDPGVAELTLQFISVVGMGATIGIVIGVAGAWLIRRVDDPMIEIAVTTSLAYGSFVAAQTLGASGVISTVAAGMLCASYGVRTGMSATTKATCGSFREYVAFALNSIVFLLIGLEVRLPLLISYWLPILAAYLVVTLGRGLVIAVNQTLAGRARSRMRSGWCSRGAAGGAPYPWCLCSHSPPPFPIANFSYR